MALHILQLGPYPPPEGGVSRNMLAIRDAIRERGDRCTIVATSQSTSVTPEPDVYHPRSALALIKLLATLKCDVLHLHVGGNLNSRVIALAAAVSMLGRRKCVLTLHSGAYPLTEEAKAATPNSIRGRIFRRFTRIIAVNDQIADVFRRYGVSEDRIKVIPPYSSTPPDPSVVVPETLAEFCRTHSPMLVAVGGLEKDYDPLFQIAAMKNILNELPNAGLMIVGDGSMRGEVEKAAEASGYAVKICIAGNVEHAVTLHLISDADILLRTTLFDGDAISVREALFLGTPVVATDNGMRPAGVELVQIGDSAGLAKAVNELASREKGPNHGDADKNSNIDAVLKTYAEFLK